MEKKYRKKYSFVGRPQYLKALNARECLKWNLHFPWHFTLHSSRSLLYSSSRVSTCFLRCFSLSLPFSRLASTLILLALSVSAYFNPKRFHQKLELKWFLSIQHSRFSSEYCCFVFWLEISSTENRWCFQLPTNQYDFPLKTRVINSFLARLHIY